MMAHLVGLAGGAVLLLARALIALRVRWPLADTIKVAGAAAAMAATGRFVVGEVHPAPLALAAAGAAMTAVLGLAVLALDVAGIRALAVRVIRSGAPRPRREPLGREETGPA